MIMKFFTRRTLGLVKPAWKLLHGDRLGARMCRYRHRSSTAGIRLLCSKPSHDETKKTRVTPMMKQYLQIRENPQYRDHIVLFQMGDFFELFFEDAVKASKILNIALTKRGTHKDSDIPMAGVPYHARDAYVRRLVRAGEKVVVAEQTEPVETARRRGPSSIVKREVTQIVTPGTLVEAHHLQPSEHNYLATIWASPEKLSDKDTTVGICWLELSTGEFFSKHSSFPNLIDDLGIFPPAELVIPKTLTKYQEIADAVSSVMQSILQENAIGLEDTAISIVDYDEDVTPTHLVSGSFCDQLGRTDLSYLNTEDLSCSEANAIFVALRYAAWTQQDTLPKLKLLKQISELGKQQSHVSQSGYVFKKRAASKWRTLQMDATTRKALEIHYPSSGKGRGKGSLVNCIDRCSHAAGSRALTTRLTVPCADADIVRGRHAAVAWLAERHNVRKKVRSILSREANGDIQRALQRICISSRKTNPEDLILVREVLSALQIVGRLLLNENTLPTHSSTLTIDQEASDLWHSIDFDDNALRKYSSIEFDDTCSLEAFLSNEEFERMISKKSMDTPGIRLLVPALLVPLNDEQSTGIATVYSLLKNALVGLDDENNQIDDEFRSSLKPGAAMKKNRQSFIKRGFDQGLDKLLELRDDSKSVVSELQEEYRQTVNVPSLKVRHTAEQGYTVEVTNRHARVVADWNDRCQDTSSRFQWAKSLKNAVRYKNRELADLDKRIADAASRADAIENRIVDYVASQVRNIADNLHAVATAAAILDVHSTFAEVASLMDLHPPVVYDEKDTNSISTGCLYLNSCRHLVVERSLREGWQMDEENMHANATHAKRSFVANDILMPDNDSYPLDNSLRNSTINFQQDVHGDLSRVWLLTGPNMGGKSTFLRQVAHCVILAQSGSFVPAAAAAVGIADRIFARVGSNDDLVRDKSTFMVEMQETSALCRYSTPRSLVLVDEVGRGTATAGMSIWFWLYK